MEESLKKQANLRLLQRTCCKNNNIRITDILATATHAVLYEFDAAQQNWKKCQTEGSLFLVTDGSSHNCSYSIVILNRNSTDNFQLQVTASLQLQHQEPYLILRMSMTNKQQQQQQQSEQTQTIWGIWFHNADERVAMHQILQTVIETLKEQPIAPPAPPRSASAPHPPTSAAAAAAAVDAEATALAAVTLKSVLGIGTETDNTTTSSSSGANSNEATAPPAAAAAASSSVSAAEPTTTPTLDKKSLQLALLSLIQDDRFLDLLHSQYLRVARTRAKKNQQHQQQGEGSSST